jgi:hypothetical protein
MCASMRLRKASIACSEDRCAVSARTAADDVGYDDDVGLNDDVEYDGEREHDVSTDAVFVGIDGGGAARKLRDTTEGC